MSYQALDLIMEPMSAVGDLASEARLQRAARSLTAILYLRKRTFNDGLGATEALYHQ